MPVERDGKIHGAVRPCRRKAKDFESGNGRSVATSRDWILRQSQGTHGSCDQYLRCFCQLTRSWKVDATGEIAGVRLAVSERLDLRETEHRGDVGKDAKRAPDALKCEGRKCKCFARWQLVRVMTEVTSVWFGVGGGFRHCVGVKRRGVAEGEGPEIRRLVVVDCAHAEA